MNDLKVEFQRWQSEGFLGDPAGENAYAYLRASSEKQVEEGSSFPRQIEHIHKAALRDHLRVPLELIFFDDGFTGFEFEHRPALLKLRHEAFSKARASHLVIEDIDRLSRNADWQQGFLLEELTRHQVEVHFFINPGSQLERYVRGYIAQEGMKKDIERMRMGTLYKAMDGRITAKRPRYGYVITDRRNSHYVLHPDESKIVRQVYEKMIYEGWSLKATCRWLNDRGIPSRFRPQWEPSALQKIISSTVYKGEFIANKLYFEKTDRLTPSGRPAYVERVRPESEWIVIPVPAVVTPEEWQMAQDALRRNNLRSMRNGKRHSWLVQGILRCDVCREFAMCTGLSWPSKSSKHRMVRYYKCNSRASEKKRLKGDICKSPLVKADLLERKVWEKVEEVIYHPDLIISRLEQRNHEEYAVGIQEQIAYIDQQLAALAKERSKYEAAYERDIYSLDEFEAKMFDLRAKN